MFSHFWHSTEPQCRTIEFHPKEHRRGNSPSELPPANGYRSELSQCFVYRYRSSPSAPYREPNVYIRGNEGRRTRAGARRQANTSAPTDCQTGRVVIS
ncbi:hypothetical protein EVAR_61540_1 [Eumeta japonica]|uniref:Uncharacterized protein n=1 Tax=Eumeta variegata TaxID=151549 RepID=A0A4C1ZAX3_EUMVA|nr:hypothetical protein EVAR_61540_1 [Eumeta japonica]